jgi:hypothetical protein
MSAARPYGRVARERSHPRIDSEWIRRAVIALAVFLGFLALGRVSATTHGTGEATAPAALAGAPHDALTPSRLAGEPPLEQLFVRAAATGAASNAVHRERRIHERSSAPVVASSAPAPDGGGETVQTPAPQQAGAAPVASTPRVTRAPAHARSRTHGSAGGSFDSSG